MGGCCLPFTPESLASVAKVIPWHHPSQLAHGTLADLGGATGMRSPTGPNSFIFTHAFTEKCPRQKSAPPKGNLGFTPDT